MSCDDNGCYSPAPQDKFESATMSSVKEQGKSDAASHLCTAEVASPVPRHSSAGEKRTA